MKKEKITKQEVENFDSVFSTESFSKKSVDYFKDNWFKKDNYNVLPIEWFRIGGFQEYEKEHHYFERLIENQREFILASFPLHSGLPTYDKSLERILDNHSTPKPTEESKDIFKGVKDFYDYLKNEDDIYLFNEIIYVSNLELFIIISVDIEVIFICYNNDLKEKIEKLYKDYPWKYDYESYLNHIEDFRERGLI